MKSQQNNKTNNHTTNYSLNKVNAQTHGATTEHIKTKEKLL